MTKEMRKQALDDPMYDVEVRIRNARLKRTVEREFGTAAEMAGRAHSLGYTTFRASDISKLINLKMNPVTKRTGDLCRSAKTISALLPHTPTYLFPEEAYKLPLVKGTIGEMYKEYFVKGKPVDDGPFGPKMGKVLQVTSA